MDEPPGSKVSTRASKTYGATVRTLRRFTQKTLNKEPSWRVRGTELKTGYEKVR
jgi:hydrogenase small subunit